MFKNYLILFLILFLTNCAPPSTALLGPAFTGATTKSAAQATLSLGTNLTVQTIRKTSKKTKKEVIKIVKRIENFTEYPNKLNLLNFHN